MSSTIKGSILANPFSPLDDDVWLIDDSGSSEEGVVDGNDDELILVVAVGAIAEWSVHVSWISHKFTCVASLDKEAKRPGLEGENVSLERLCLVVVSEFNVRTCCKLVKVCEDNICANHNRSYSKNSKKKKDIESLVCRRSHNLITPSSL